MTRVGILFIVASLGWWTQAGVGAVVDSLYLATPWTESASHLCAYAAGMWGMAGACLLLATGLLLCLWDGRSEDLVELPPIPGDSRSSRREKRPSERLEPVSV